MVRVNVLEIPKNSSVPKTLKISFSHEFQKISNILKNIFQTKTVPTEFYTKLFFWFFFCNCSPNTTNALHQHRPYEEEVKFSSLVRSHELQRTKLMRTIPRSVSLHFCQPILEIFPGYLPQTPTLRYHTTKLVMSAFFSVRNDIFTTFKISVAMNRRIDGASQIAEFDFDIYHCKLKITVPVRIKKCRKITPEKEVRESCILILK